MTEAKQNSCGEQNINYRTPCLEKTSENEEPSDHIAKIKVLKHLERDRDLIVRNINI